MRTGFAPGGIIDLARQGPQACRQLAP